MESVLNAYSFSAILVVCAVVALVPWRYVVARIKGTAKLEDKGDTACVVVGMERSSKYGACPGAGADAERMQKLLSKYGSTIALTNSAATTASVVAALTEAVKKPLCLFFYSGHGGQSNNPKASDGSGKSEFLALNNGPLYDYAIWDVISKAKGRVVVIFDCCHSGTMFRSASGSEETVQEPFSGFEFKLLNETPVSAASFLGVLSWAGCPANEFSYGDANGGVFTNGILKAYSSSKTYDEVYADAVKRTTTQRPVKTVIGTGFAGKVFR